MDPSKIKALPVQTTLLLVNQFVTQTTVFLNSFSETMEKKVSKVSSRITELEILMSVFEAKLHSIPTGGVEYSAESLPDTAPTPAPPQPESGVVPPPPGGAPPAGEAPTSEIAEDVAAPAAPAGPMVKDHADYSKFFKMLKVGVPQPIIEGKMRDAGLDPAYLDTPEAPAPGDAAPTAENDNADID